MKPMHIDISCTVLTYSFKKTETIVSSIIRQKIDHAVEAALCYHG